jgi:hypothetical protein
MSSWIFARSDECWIVGWTIQWMMNSSLNDSMNGEYFVWTNDKWWIVHMNERWIVHMNETNDERWIGIMNERTNDQNFGSITAEQILFGWTNGRTIGLTNKQTMNIWVNDRINDRTILVLVWCLCGSGSELPWNGLGWHEGRPLPFYL